MSESFVSLNNLTLAYEDTVAVPKLNLDIQKGELLTLLGPSGCGKTTTMRAIAGLLNPRSGTIVIDGADVTKVPANKRGVGLVFQSYALFPHLSAFENVAFGLRLRKISNGEIKRRVGQSLETVELGKFANRKPSELSGGQQQRAALGRALVKKPSVLLLDEPTSGLDDKNTEIGNPSVEGATVEAKLLDNVKDRTILVFHKRRRKNSRKKNGHRQQHSKIQITKILAKGGKVIDEAKILEKQKAVKKEKKEIKKTTKK